MLRKILLTLAVFILVILPFLIGNAITSFSPYVEGNSFQTFVLIWSAISVAFILMVVALLKYLNPSFEKLVIGGGLLFLLVSPIIGIVGLESAPDLSLKMLEHPEREHLRYTFLFMAAILFGVFGVLLLFMSDRIQIKQTTQWILAVFFVLAFVEFIWEFTHHYFYPEALKEWIAEGKTAEAFGKSYDNIRIINIGAAGRFIEFSLIILLSLLLYKLRQVKIWFPIVAIPFSLAGIASATVIYITEMNLPKGFEILFLFFIPGIPFLLLYWLGVALLTKLGSEPQS